MSGQISLDGLRGMIGERVTFEVLLHFRIRLVKAVDSGKIGREEKSRSSLEVNINLTVVHGGICEVCYRRSQASLDGLESGYGLCLLERAGEVGAACVGGGEVRAGDMRQALWRQLGADPVQEVLQGGLGAVEQRVGSAIGSTGGGRPAGVGEGSIGVAVDSTKKGGHGERLWAYEPIYEPGLAVTVAVADDGGHGRPHVRRGASAGCCGVLGANGRHCFTLLLGGLRHEAKHKGKGKGSPWRMHSSVVGLACMVNVGGHGDVRPAMHIRVGGEGSRRSRGSPQRSMHGSWKRAETQKHLCLSCLGRMRDPIQAVPSPASCRAESRPS